MNPQTLDAAGIAQRIPHSGSMCLLSALDSWTEDRIHCRASSHRDPGNPLRCDGQLLAATAIEYASQAMALHGTLSAPPGFPPTPGFLASVRGVKLHVPRLDTVNGQLRIHAHKLAGDTNQAMYAFTLHSEGDQLLVEGRATVILSPQAHLRSLPPEGAVRQRPGEASSAAGSLVE